MFVGLFVASALAAGFSRKFNAGPPSEFASRSLPAPTLRNSQTARFDVYPTSRVYAQQFSLDSSSGILTFAAPGATTASFSLTDSAGTPFPLPKPSFDPLPLGTRHLTAASFVLTNVSATGPFTFTATLGTEPATPTVARVHVYAHGGVVLQARLASFHTLRTGHNATVTAQLVDAKGRTLTARALGKGYDLRADLDVTKPDGTNEDIEMHDDGKHGDGLANDGTYGAGFTLPTPGDYVARAHFSSADLSLARTSAMVIPVSPIIHATFAGTARVRAAGCDAALTQRCGVRMAIDIDVAAPVGSEVYVYSEVWGTDAAGAIVPVAWVQTLADVTKTGNGTVVTVELDGSWLVAAGASTPLQLRNVRMQCAGSSVPVATTAGIPVTDALGVVAKAVHATHKVPHSELEARQGVCPAHICKRALRGGVNTSATHKLVLVHGYCSDATTWPVADFPNALVFSDPGQNRGNLEFAKLVMQYVQDQKADSIALVGHSQGGPVSTTVHFTYWSGMDAEGLSGRLVQSVGSPYKGCSAAGSLADMGAPFGVGCGANSDLDPDGASLWLATVPAATRSQVNYYSTTYELGSWFGDSCSLPMNAILAWPNDGVTEEANTDLTGGWTVGTRRSGATPQA